MAVTVEVVDRVNRAEEEILRLMNQHNVPMSARVVTENIQLLGIDKSSIVSAIWFLIDRNAIRLTRDLKIAPGSAS